MLSSALSEPLLILSLGVFCGEGNTAETKPNNGNRIRFLGLAEVDILLGLASGEARAALIGRGTVLS